MDLACPDCDHAVELHGDTGCEQITQDVLADFGKHCRCRWTRENVVEFLRSAVNPGKAAS